MIVGWLQRLPSFGAKVTWLLTLTGGLAVLLVSVGLVLFSYLDLRNEVFAAVRSQTQLVAMNSGAPLAFQDRESGEEALAALRRTPHVASATLFDASGALFAQYARNRDPAPTLALGDPGLLRQGEWMVMTVPVRDVGQRLGTVQVVFDLDRLNRRLATMLGVVLGVALGTMLLIRFVASNLRHVLVKPVDELARTAREISTTRNFGLRAERTSTDEIGQFTEAFNEMLDQIQQQHAEIQSARREAERASQMKDEFLATLSHELRTPMAPILGWAQILLRSTGDAQRVRQGAEIIERNAQIQTQIIDDLLDMSRIISGKLLLRMQPVDLRAVVKAAVATVQPAAESRGVQLECDLQADMPLARGDASRLQQVAWNLLSNAIKFTPRGGSVTVQLHAREREARLVVRDTGQGIAPEFLPHVFERFRQADSSTTRAHGGLGIGLALVKQLVEQHGGEVRAESAGAELGSSFTISLPLPQDAEAAGVAAVSSTLPEDTRDAAPLHGMRVMVIDDEADALVVMTHLLSDAGAAVDVAASTEEAMAMLPHSRPDVIISDIGMPVSDGYDLIKRVRALPAEQGGQIPAIALTAFARSEDRSRALLAGFQLHLGKPVEAVELIAATATLRRQPRAAGASKRGG